MAINTKVTLRVQPPAVPDTVVVEAGMWGEKEVPVGELTVSALKNLGREWTKNLIEKAHPGQGESATAPRARKTKAKAGKAES